MTVRTLHALTPALDTIKRELGLTPQSVHAVLQHLAHAVLMAHTETAAPLPSEYYSFASAQHTLETYLYMTRELKVPSSPTLKPEPAAAAPEPEPVAAGPFGCEGPMAAVEAVFERHGFGVEEVAQ